MAHRQIDCVGCDSAFTVDDDQEESRCVSCGTNYSGPWDDPVILSSPVLTDAEIQRANATGDVEPAAEPATDGGGSDAIEIDAADGATVEIVIRIE